jgi:hypothetical protein
LAIRQMAAKASSHEVDDLGARYTAFDHAAPGLELRGGVRLWMNAHVAHGVLVLRQRPDRNGSPAARLRSLTRLGTRISYTLDNGVVHIQRLPGGVAVVSRLPTWPEDPLKPLRAAAFAGWVVAERPTERHLERLAAKIADRFPFQ